MSKSFQAHFTSEKTAVSNRPNATYRHCDSVETWCKSSIHLLQLMNEWMNEWMTIDFKGSQCRTTMSPSSTFNVNEFFSMFACFANTHNDRISHCFSLASRVKHEGICHHFCLPFLLIRLLVRLRRLTLVTILIQYYCSVFFFRWWYTVTCSYSLCSTGNIIGLYMDVWELFKWCWHVR